MGSFHCLGMCGPIAMNLPLGEANSFGRIHGILLYNVGRIVTYSVGGALVGVVGFGFRLAGFQQVLSIGLGLFLLFNLFSPRIFKHLFPNSLVLNRLRSKIIYAIQNSIKRNTKSSLFLTGLINGLLPCGLVYAALAASAVTGNIWSGSLYMAIFGIGTVPTMFSISYFANISLSFRAKMRSITPVITVIVGCLLVLRGLGLGIPYLSPEFLNAEIPMCH